MFRGSSACGFLPFVDAFDFLFGLSCWGPCGLGCWLASGGLVFWLAVLGLVDWLALVGLADWLTPLGLAACLVSLCLVDWLASSGLVGLFLLLLSPFVDGVLSPWLLASIVDSWSDDAVDDVSACVLWVSSFCVDVPSISFSLNSSLLVVMSLSACSAECLINVASLIWPMESCLS